MAIKDGSLVRCKPGGIDGDGDDRPIGRVSKAGAAVAGLFMGNPEWDDNTCVFVVFDDPKGINLGWIHPSKLEEIEIDNDGVIKVI